MVTISSQLQTEYFLLPLSLISVLLFVENYKKIMNMGIFLSLATWYFLSLKINYPLIELNNSNAIVLETLKKINFLGSFIFVLFFILNYISKVQREKQRQENFLNTVLNAIPAFLSFIDLDFRYKYVNKKFELELKKPASEFVGKKMGEVVGLSTYEILKPNFEKALGGQPVSFDYLSPASLETPRHFSVSFIPITEDNGKVSGVVSYGTEISEHKNLQNELEIKTKELNEFFNTSIDLLCIAGLDGYFKKLNPAFSKLLGYSTEELCADSFLSFIHPDDVLPTKQVVETLSQGISTIKFENRYRCKNGNYKILSWTATPDLPSQLIYAAARDMTEFKNSESQLKQTMSAISDSAIVTILNKDGKITSINDIYAKITDFSMQEILARGLDLKNELLDYKLYNEIWKNISNGQVWSGETQIKNKFGKIYYLQTVISPIKNLMGEIENYISIRFDVTEQRIIEQKLIEAQAVAKIGSWSLDVNTNRLSFSNQMFVMLGIDRIDQNHFLNEAANLIYEDDRELWLHNINECKLKGQSFKMRLRSKSGDNFNWFEIIGQNNGLTNAQAPSVSGTWQDITDLVKAEEETKQERAKALHSSKLASLGEMAASIAHEINNPLGIIAGSAELLNRYQNDPAKAYDKILSIQKASERISRIVSGLRKFSRTGDKEFKQNYNLNSIIVESIGISEIIANRYGVPIEFTAYSEQSNLWCDEIEIEQVLVNLINNSIDAVKNLPQKWIKVQLAENNYEMSVKVIDSGTGIPVQIKDQIFNPFFTTKPVGEGTGLGLSIVKGILANHNATIELVTEMPNTCFEIKFKKKSL